MLNSLHDQTPSIVSNTPITPTKRISFARSKHPVDYPDFLEIQLKSFQDFFQL